MHRPSNVDSQSGLKNNCKMLNKLSRLFRLFFQSTPEQKKMNQEGLSFNDSVLCIEPLSYINFFKFIELCIYRSH